jgi:hypothetical protein
MLIQMGILSQYERLARGLGPSLINVSLKSEHYGGYLLLTIRVQKFRCVTPPLLRPQYLLHEIQFKAP